MQAAISRGIKWSVENTPHRERISASMRGVRRHCSRCGEQGHDVRTCAAEAPPVTPRAVRRVLEVEVLLD